MCYFECVWICIKRENQLFLTTRAVIPEVGCYTGLIWGGEEQYPMMIMPTISRELEFLVSWKSLQLSLRVCIAWSL